ncbi:hypothetical protein C8R43DRAFT_969762 [Mycena crocata]|nr:hypothetical protein C8R43DRAFT_969762 [Mycena crocata]
MPGRVSDLRTRLAGLDAAINNQQLVLEQLETERRDVELELQSFTYPVLTLPHEITSEIFIHCLPDEDEQPNKRHAPLLFLTVCKAWNDVATSIPELWTALSLDIDLLPSAFQNAGVFQTIVAKWFGHAGSLPLTLILRGYMEAVLGNEDCLKNIISQYSARLRRLNLHLEIDDFTMLDYLEGTATFPRLESLTIGLPYNDGSIVEQDIEIFDHAPALRQLTLIEEAIPSFVALLSWQTLTKFHGGSFTIEECLEVLRWAPLLTDCTFCVSAEPYYGREIVSHTSLQSFSLTEDPEDGDCTADIFKQITLPSITTLRIAGVGDLDDDDSFQTFISRSSPPLRTFSFRGYEDEMGPILPECFRCLTMITDLEIGEVEDDFEEHFFRLLENDGKDFLPSLQNLSFVDCTYPGSGYEAMARALCSRWAPKQDGVADLLSFRLLWPKDVRPYFDKTTVLPLAEVASTGVNIHIGPATHNYFDV